MPSSHKAQYNDRQKKRIKQLEQLYDSVARQVEGLAEQNARLRLRNDVLSALVQSSDVVDEFYASSAAPTGPVGPDDRVRMITLALEWPELVAQLRALVEAAEADTADPNKLATVVQAVRTLATHGIQAAARNDCERHVLHASVELELLFPALQVPEEEHWQQVVAALQLTPDQCQKALLARELFQASMVSTLAPRDLAASPVAASPLAGAHPSSSAAALPPLAPVDPPGESGSPAQRLAKAALMGGSRLQVLYSAYQQATAALPSTDAPPAAAALPPMPLPPQPTGPTIPQLHLPTLAPPLPMQPAAMPPSNPSLRPSLPQLQPMTASSLPHLPTVMRPLQPPAPNPLQSRQPYLHLRALPASLGLPHLPPSPPLFMQHPPQVVSNPPQLTLPALISSALPLQPTTMDPAPHQPDAASRPTLSADRRPRGPPPPNPQAASQHQRLSAAVGLHWPNAMHLPTPTPGTSTPSPDPSRTPTPAPDETPSLRQLEEYLVKFWDWSHTLAVYFGTMLLEPLQAAHSYINAQPVRLCPVAVLNTIHAMSEGQATPAATPG